MDPPNSEIWRAHPHHLEDAKMEAPNQDLRIWGISQTRDQERPVVVYSKETVVSLIRSLRVRVSKA